MLNPKNVDSSKSWLNLRQGHQCNGGDDESTCDRGGGAVPAETLLGLLQHQHQASTELFRALLPGHREPGSGGALGGGGGGLLQASGNDYEGDYYDDYK